MQRPDTDRLGFKSKKLSVSDYKYKNDFINESDVITPSRDKKIRFQ